MYIKEYDWYREIIWIIDFKDFEDRFRILRAIKILIYNALRIHLGSRLQKEKIVMIVRSIHDRCRPMAQIPAVFIGSLHQKRRNKNVMCNMREIFANYRDRTVSLSAKTCVELGLAINLVKFSQFLFLKKIAWALQ